MSRLPSDLLGRSRRARAACALAAFVAALLAGVFLHPLGDRVHVCGVTQGHADTPPAHAHDDATCALCHLVHELKQVRPLAAPAPSAGVLPAVCLAPRALAAWPAARTPSVHRSRAPPAIG